MYVVVVVSWSQGKGKGYSTDLVQSKSHKTCTLGQNKSTKSCFKIFFNNLYFGKKSFLKVVTTIFYKKNWLCAPFIGIVWKLEFYVQSY